MNKKAGTYEKADTTNKRKNAEKRDGNKNADKRNASKNDR